MRQLEFDALVSLAYNIGAGQFSRSAVLQQVNELGPEAAAYHFGAWRRAGGKILLGLVRRRALEALIFAYAKCGEAWALDLVTRATGDVNPTARA